MPQVDLVTVVVGDYDEAIKFFVDALGFGDQQAKVAVFKDLEGNRWDLLGPVPSGEAE